MRTDPKITSGLNVYWIRFFLTAIYSTMYVRDHARPEFHKALGIDIDWYDREVFRKTSAISRQVFPIELDIDHPRWQKNLTRMKNAFFAIDAAKKKGGPSGFAGRMVGSARAAFAFVGLYTIPVIRNDLPADVRLEPIY